MRTSGLALCAALGGCVAAARPAEHPAASLKGVVHFQVLERAHDGGPFPLHRSGDNVIDANSVLVVRFARPKEDAPPPSAEWSAVNALLAQTRDLARRRAEIEELPFQDAASRKARLDAVQAFAAEFRVWVVGLFDQLTAAGLKKEAAEAIVQQGYEGVERWLAERLDRLKGEASALTRGKEQFRVTVQTFHDALGGDRKALHVQNYDSLPLGKLQPIDRFGLKLTPREVERLTMALDQADQAASLIRDYRESGRTIRQGLVKILREADEKLAELGRRIAERPDVEALLQPLKKLAADPDPAKSVPAKKVLDSLKPVRDLAQDLAARVAAVDEARRRLREAISSPNLVALAAGGNEAFKAATAFVDAMKELPKRLADAAAALREAQEPLRLLGVEVGRDLLLAFLDTLQVPEVVDFLKFAASYVRDGVPPLAGGGEALADHESVLIPRPLDSLPDGEIELDRAGMAVGDRVTIVVRLQDKDKPDVGEEAIYRASVKLTGIQRALTGQLMFARAAKGDTEAERWKPNVAAMATWHYRFRNPTALGEAWNFLNPGVGFHLANLDQGSDSIEFGGGVTASFFDGMVTGGYGWNFSRTDDGEYYYVGIGLLETLEKIRSLTTKP